MQILMLQEKLPKWFDESLKKQFANRYKFSNMISINLFYCCRKVFTHMNT